MVSKCANPACPALLRKLNGGKVFRVDRKHAEGGSHAEFFWVCAHCATTVRVNTASDGEPFIGATAYYQPLGESGHELLAVGSVNWHH
jgi:hypothetical protein